MAVYKTQLCPSNSFLRILLNQKNNWRLVWRIFLLEMRWLAFMLLAVGTAASVGAEEGDSHEDFDDIPSVSRRYFSSLLLLFLFFLFFLFFFLFLV